MKKREIERRLREDGYSAQALAEALLREARSLPGRAAQRLNGEDRARSRALLNLLEELAITALAAAPAANDPADEAWLLRTLGEELRAARRRIAALVDSLLGEGKTTLEGGRVRDEAYRVAHEMVNHAMDARQPLDFAMFCKFPEDMRDEEIEHFRKSRPWRRVLEGR
jgi:hypothetical protein